MGFDFNRGWLSPVTGDLQDTLAVEQDTFEVRSSRGRATISALASVGVPDGETGALAERVRYRSVDLPPEPGLDGWLQNTMGGNGARILPTGRIAIPETSLIEILASGNGGAIMTGLYLTYDKSGGRWTLPANIAGKKKLIRRIAGTGVSEALADIVLGAILDLEASKSYAIMGFYGFGVDLLSVKFAHTDFNGLQPGGLPGATVPGAMGLVDFGKLGELPTFTGKTACQVVTMSITAEQDVSVYVVLAQVD